MGALRIQTKPHEVICHLVTATCMLECMLIHVTVPSVYKDKLPGKIWPWRKKYVQNYQEESIILQNVVVINYLCPYRRNFVLSLTFFLEISL